MLLSVARLGSPHGDCRSRIQTKLELDPDPFDVAQGRGEHSRTTIITFGGDALLSSSRALDKLFRLFLELYLGVLGQQPFF
jgi:hypothetical protein